MKKIVLICSILTMGFMLSSCLDSGDSSYTGVMEFSYVTMDNSGLIYARSEGGMITSPQIKLLDPGKCYLLSYTWSSENGTTSSVDDFLISNVVLTAEPVQVPSTMLILQDAPKDDIGTPFTSFSRPYFHPGIYFGDFWAFSYQWKKKEGETASVEFYKSTEDTGNPDEVMIDVRLNKTGTPTGTTEKTESGRIAVNMNPLRLLLGSSSGTQTKNIYLRFRYYREGQSEPFTDPYKYLMTIYTD
ncbi:MAG: hypothetical protein PHN83_05340 [Dysgonamonadaceae bacterium]|jgi:hypothetical protein|nr:hypothetical protein [Dysgonamonadaceae bacterium]NLH29179.1 hypothetical protein [Bacteroidales bacterium]